MGNYRTGLPAKSLKDVNRFGSYSLIDFIELKLGNINREDGENIYNLVEGIFIPNKPLVEDLVDSLKKNGKTPHIHLPYEEMRNKDSDIGLCQADEEHHELLIARNLMLARMFSDFKDVVFTIHPPAYRIWGEQLWDEDEAVRKGKELYDRMGQEMMKGGFDVRIGVENTQPPKLFGNSYTGYKPEQIIEMIGDNPMVGITADTGHGLLSYDGPMNTYFNTGRVFEVHLSSNRGNTSDMSLNDDVHLPITPENHPHYWTFMERIAESELPVLLEISGLINMSDEQIFSYISGLKMDIER
jgi:sugar phosphate isomerase/epimerase